jgi:hypothetical protein
MVSWKRSSLPLVWGGAGHLHHVAERVGGHVRLQVPSQDHARVERGGLTFVDEGYQSGLLNAARLSHLLWAEDWMSGAGRRAGPMLLQIHGSGITHLFCSEKEFLSLRKDDLPDSNWL